MYQLNQSIFKLDLKIRVMFYTVPDSQNVKGFTSTCVHSRKNKKTQFLWLDENWNLTTADNYLSSSSSEPWDIVLWLHLLFTSQYVVIFNETMIFIPMCLWWERTRRAFIETFEVVFLLRFIISKTQRMNGLIVMYNI